ncbi:hypothetical protein CS0771_30100 [Catellatospora sp. IY07-71]|uniref:hypothetical protein n=1 Tax=Catellatospora sp. IY07-71 TaxID=2728827 RepID=UPI001BB45E10|nr:hypothetical protein [Catellatospora sp. IY07-71]BCJ73466.1 hypothetical protein CS0771_30100 [Catellatospora sp. IY07-71]
MLAPVPTDLAVSPPSREYRDIPPPRRIGSRVFLAVLGLALAAAAVGFIRDLAAVPEPPPPSTVQAPDTLGGRPRTTDDEWVKSNLEFIHGILSDGANSVVMEVYGDEVMVFAAGGAIESPDRALDGLLESARSQGYHLDTFTMVDPGPLGGVASCGRARRATEETVLCAWASTGSNGMFEWYYATLAQARAEFAGLRAEVETRD